MSRWSSTTNTIYYIKRMTRPQQTKDLRTHMSIHIQASLQPFRLSPRPPLLLRVLTCTAAWSLEWTTRLVQEL
jgi:hypothetical protein